MAQHFKVMFDFNAEEDGELSVFAGEVVLSSVSAPGAEATPDGWILVHADGAAGFVPRDYLEETFVDTSLSPAPVAPMANLDGDSSIPASIPMSAHEFDAEPPVQMASRSNSFAAPEISSTMPPPPPTTQAPATLPSLNVDTLSRTSELISTTPAAPLSLDSSGYIPASYAAHANAPTAASANGAQSLSNTPRATGAHLKSSASLSSFPSSAAVGTPSAKGKGISALIQASKKVFAPYYHCMLSGSCHTPCP